MSGPIGLDIPAALQIADRLGIDETPTLLAKLRLLERATLRIMHQANQAKGGEADGQ